ncbi:MAG: hypothetical protein IKY01_13695 [Prevotella sp.]|nr:hypothetical protein [Prevotella sp.]
MKRILVSFLIASSAMTVFAQGATNSPYSQFGLGEIAQQGSSQNRGMDGLGIALHSGNQVNTANPASYAYVDSLTMLFDMGLSASLTHFEENGVKKNARTGNFEYAVGSFRLMKNVGATFGVLPVTNVGYEYVSSKYIADAQSTMSTSYSGDGGLQKLFLGLGARLGNLSAGFNIGYLWGGYTHNVVLSSSTAVNSLAKKYETDISSYVLDFGLQYTLRLGKKDMLMLGATYGLGHQLNADATCDIINSNSTISKADTTHWVINNAFELPHTYGAGLAYSHQNTLTIGLDGTIQRWGDLKFPKESDGQYQLATGMLKDSYKVTLGTEWVPRYNSRRLIDRVKYRIGASYMTPYYKIGNIDGPKQFSLSAGFGIPIQNQINARSYLNISAQWVKQSVDGLLKENTFRINLGVTFNERWFAKWKVE